MIRKILSFSPVKHCLIAACLFFALMVMIGSIPGEAVALSAKVDDKLLHIFAYSFLSSLIYVGLTGSIFGRAMRTLLLIALLGGLDEAIQRFMPYRNANFSDWAFDMLAATISISALALLHIILLKQKTDQDITSIRLDRRQAD